MATNGTINLYTKRSSKSTITVSFVNYPGATAASTTYYVLAGGTASVTLPTPSRDGYSFKGWNAGTSIADNTRPVSNTLASAGESVTLSANATYHGVWLQTFTATVTTSNAEVKGVTNGATYEYGEELTISISFSESNSLTYTIKGTSATLDGAAADKTGSAALSSYTCYVKGAVSVNASSTGCITAGTLVMMADGTQKVVEELTPDDYLLVFNHETGRYEAAKIMFIDSDGWCVWRIVNLCFANGTTVRVIYEHGFFDRTLGKYVYIDEFNAAEYIGHEFATTTVTEDGYVTGYTTLTGYYVSEEYTGCYSPTTEYHLNLIVEGMLSMPGGIEGMFNFFDYDSETLAYDQQAMQEDIETYGLMTYEDFADYMSYEVYCLFPAQYVGISLGKGLMTEEYLLYLIERYIVGLDLESSVSDST